MFVAETLDHSPEALRNRLVQYLLGEPLQLLSLPTKRTHAHGFAWVEAKILGDEGCFILPEPAFNIVLHLFGCNVPAHTQYRFVVCEKPNAS